MMERQISALARIIEVYTNATEAGAHSAVFSLDDMEVLLFSVPKSFREEATHGQGQTAPGTQPPPDRQPED